MTRAFRKRGPRPLEGIVALDFSRVLSGPHATRILTDLGAEVIKVEPPMGDLTRFTNPRVNSLSTYFMQQNTGKKNISVNLDLPAARKLMARLAEKVDVLIENFSSGVMTKMGLDYSTLATNNPRLIYVSITGFGSDGPWATRKAYAPVINAESGLTKSQGDARGGIYSNDPHSHGDVYTGMYAAMGALAALHQRHATGLGQFVDVSMAESMLYANEHAHDDLWDREPPTGVTRSFQPGDYPVLRAANGEVAVATGHPAENGTFDFFISAMGMPQLVQDPRFRDQASRLVHLDELQELIRTWAATCANFSELAEKLTANRIPVGRLQSTADLAATDWSNFRKATVSVSDRGIGQIRLPNSPWHFSDSDTSVIGEPRYRGEDNREILSRLLGLSESEIDDYERDGVIISRGPR